MFKLPTADEYRWLASQRPRNKRQNRILLLNAKRTKAAATAIVR